MALTEPGRDATDLVLDALMDQGLEPRTVDRGRIDELRGGIRCFDLKAGDGVDAAVLLSMVAFGRYPSDETRSLFKVEYAVRGTLKGVLPGRILTRMAPEFKGLLRKRLVALRWGVPTAPRGGARSPPLLGSGGLPPSPGELWEGGPHQELTERLNGDTDLMEALRATPRGEGDDPLILSVFTDGWGESIRVRGDPWFEARDLPLMYVAPAYLGIVNLIGRHIKEVRKSFGGLTF
jgi:hypothetical protein